MAEHAGIVDDAGRSHIIGSVVSRRHRPVATLLRVPTQRQLLQRVVLSAVDVGSDVIAGTDYEVHQLLVDIGFMAVETHLPSALVVFAAAHDHFEVSVGSCVIEGLAELFNSGLWLEPIERLTHAGLRETCGNASMARRAQGRIDVVINILCKCGSGRNSKRRNYGPGIGRPHRWKHDQPLRKPDLGAAGVLVPDVMPDGSDSTRDPRILYELLWQCKGSGCSDGVWQTPGENSEMKKQSQFGVR